MYWSKNEFFLQNQQHVTFLRLEFLALYENESNDTKIRQHPTLPIPPNVCRLSSVHTFWTLRTLDTQGTLDGIGNVLGVTTVFENKE